MATVIGPDQFEDSLKKVIQMYGQNCASVTFQIVQDTADEAKEKLKTTNWGWTKSITPLPFLWAPLSTWMARPSPLRS